MKSEKSVNRRVDDFDDISDGDSDDLQQNLPDLQPSGNSVHYAPQASGNGPRPGQIALRRPSPKNPEPVKMPNVANLSISDPKPQKSSQWPGTAPKSTSFGEFRQQNIHKYQKDNTKGYKGNVVHNEEEYYGKIEVPVQDERLKVLQHSERSRQQSGSSSDTQPDPLPWPHCNPYLSSFGQLRMSSIKAYEEQKRREEEMKKAKKQMQRWDSDESMTMDFEENLPKQGYKKSDPPILAANPKPKPSRHHHHQNHQNRNQQHHNQRYQQDNQLQNDDIAMIQNKFGTNSRQPQTDHHYHHNQHNQHNQHRPHHRHQNPIAQQAPPQFDTQISHQRPVSRDGTHPAVPGSLGLSEFTSHQFFNSFTTSRIAELDEKLLKEADYQCFGCETLVPHSQLFVCVKPDCVLNVQCNQPVITPNQFFRLVKSFCGCCAFRGCHSAHEPTMKEALPFAIHFATLETGARLEAEFDRQAELKLEEPVDYMIAGDVPNGRLQKIPVKKYLYSAPSVAAWHERVKQLVDVLKMLSKTREDTQGFINERAAETLAYYEKLNEAVLHDLSTRKPAAEHEKKMKLEKHARTMGLPHDYYTKPDKHPASRTHSDSSAENPEITRFLDDQAKLMDALDAEVTGGHVGDVGEVAQRVDVGAVKMMYILMCRRYDLVKGSMSKEEALSDVQTELNGRHVTDEIKKAATDMFFEKMQFAKEFVEKPESSSDDQKKEEESEEKEEKNADEEDEEKNSKASSSDENEDKKEKNKENEKF